MNAEILHDYFRSVAGRRQRLGVCDCVTFTVDVLRLGFGKDYREHMQYSDRRSAVKRLRRSGGLLPAMVELFGPLQPIESLGAGSIAYFEKPRRALGVVMGEYIMVRGDGCLHRLTLNSAAGGWAVV